MGPAALLLLVLLGTVLYPNNRTRVSIGHATRLGPVSYRETVQSPDLADALTAQYGGDRYVFHFARESWQDKRKPNGERRLDDTTLLGNVRIECVSYETATHPFADLESLCGENPAGFETTSGTINFILHDIARNPHVQTKLREEILAANSSEVEVLESLPFHTSMRSLVKVCLNPITRRTRRVVIHDDVIPLKNPVTLGNGDIITSLPVKAGDMRPLLNAVKEIKLIVGALVRNLELRDTGAKGEKYVCPTVQPFVDGKAAHLPFELIPLQQ
ncbi:hypothetical protein B0H14DRAFT_3565169 [Mycena olivaceomarginata]|nr:hypothetical protein B0H14DRAFT_3565169 [Mycena olivaceomarginata]